MRVKISDPSNARWEVPGVVEAVAQKRPDKTDYKFSVTNYPFGFAITRASTGETIFNTSSPGQFQFQFLISSFLKRLAKTYRMIFYIPLYTADSGEQFNGLIFEDQYLELSTQLPKNNYIYGLGEHVHPLRLNNSGSYYTLFAAG